MKILIVDDQELALLSLTKCFTDLGYEVHCSNNIAEAIKLYDELLPNMVITDINMPIVPCSNINRTPSEFAANSAGLEIIKYIKINKEHNIPVLIQSGNTDEEIWICK
jgi:CheY-like chemotaxis protein